jgi:hypothetical protein
MLGTPNPIHDPMPAFECGLADDGAAAAPRVQDHAVVRVRRGSDRHPSAAKTAEPLRRPPAHPLCRGHGRRAEPSESGAGPTTAELEASATRHPGVHADRPAVVTAAPSQPHQNCQEQRRCQRHGQPPGCAPRSSRQGCRTMRPLCKKRHQPPPARPNTPLTVWCPSDRFRTVGRQPQRDDEPRARRRSLSPTRGHRPHLRRGPQAKVPLADLRTDARGLSPLPQLRCHGDGHEPLKRAGGAFGTRHALLPSLRIQAKMRMRVHPEVSEIAPGHSPVHFPVQRHGITGSGAIGALRGVARRFACRQAGCSGKLISSQDHR